MSFNTDNLKRWLRNLEESPLLKGVEFDSLPSDSVRSLMIGSFARDWDEASDATFKLLRKVLRAHGHGARRMDEMVDRDILRLAHTHGLLTAEELTRWLAQRALAEDADRAESPYFQRRLQRMAADIVNDANSLETALRHRFGTMPPPEERAEVSSADMDLDPAILSRLIEILHELAPGREFWAYGSRVNGGGHEGGDIDLVVRDPSVDDDAYQDLYRLREGLSQSDLPIRVDLLDWNGIPQAFRQEISRSYAVLQRAPTRPAE